MLILYPRGAKIRVDNIHYELTEEDLDVSFSTQSVFVRGPANI